MTENGPVGVAVAGARRLAALTDRRGRFTYCYDPVRNLPSRGYNILRHCGTVWAMLEVHRVHPLDEVRDAGQRAVSHLLDRYLREARNRQGLCIVEGEAVKLGGNALAILAILAVHRLTKDGALIDSARGLARCIVSNRKPDGDFVHKWDYETGKIANFYSDYYTGEALLALGALYEATREREWLDVALEVEENLARMDYGVPFQSHWCLYALELLHRHRPSALYYRHAEAIVNHILAHPVYRDSGRSTPVACRSEGLLAFLRLRKAMGKNVDEELSGTCLQTVRDNMALQLTHHRSDGSFVCGGKGLGATEVRIDYIQHNISTFLYYHEYMSELGQLSSSSPSSRAAGAPAR